MYGAMFPIEQHPQEADTEHTDRRNGRGQAPQGFFPAHRCAVGADELETPGAHAECLAAVDPESRKEQGGNQQETGTQGPQKPQRAVI